MPKDSEHKKDKFEKANKDAAIKPDEATLHTTDPQDEMEGPVSSPMQGISETVKEDDKRSKEAVDEEKRKREQG